jgi:hypothetical protein
MSEETEVFIYSGPQGYQRTFNNSKCYEFALATRRVGIYPNEKLYTTNPLQYLGKHSSFHVLGHPDHPTGTMAIFDNNGIQTEIYLNMNTCFREVPCLTDMGMLAGGRKNNRKSRKNNRKNIKKSARKNNRNL